MCPRRSRPDEPLPASTGPAGAGCRVRRERNHRLAHDLHGHSGDNPRQPSVRRAGRPLSHPPPHPCRRYRGDHLRPGVRRHHQFHCTGGHAFPARAVFPGPDNLSGGVPGAKPARRTPECRDGVLCFGHGGRGLGGRLLGGWIHPPLHWRYAFVSAAVLLLFALLAAVLGLPKDQGPPRRRADDLGFGALLARGETLRLYGVAFGSFWIFSATSIFSLFIWHSPRLPPRQSLSPSSISLTSWGR